MPEDVLLNNANSRRQCTTNDKRILQVNIAKRKTKFMAPMLNCFTKLQVHRWLFQLHHGNISTMYVPTSWNAYAVIAVVYSKKWYLFHCHCYEFENVFIVKIGVDWNIELKTGTYCLKTGTFEFLIQNRIEFESANNIAIFLLPNNVHYLPQSIR